MSRRQPIKRLRAFADDADSDDSVDDGSTISLAHLRARVRGAEAAAARERLQASAAEIARQAARLEALEQLHGQVAESLTLGRWRLRARVRGAEAAEARAQLQASAAENARQAARLKALEQLQAQVAAQALTLARWAAAFDATALLQRAVAAGDAADVRAALALGAADVEAVSPARWGGTTMLMAACYYGQSEVVRALLEAGADKYKMVIDAGGEVHTARRSADRCALIRRQRGAASDFTILELLDASLRPPKSTEAERDRAGLCTLTGAANGVFSLRHLRKITLVMWDFLGFDDSKIVLLSCRHLWSPDASIYLTVPAVQLQRACTAGDMALVRRLLSRDDAEALVASFGPSGETALMRACRAGRVDIARLLILKGANKHTALLRGAASADLPRYDAFSFAELADDPAARVALRELLDASQRPPSLRQGGELGLTLTGDVLTIVAPVLLKFLSKREQYRLAITSRATWRHVPAGMSAEDAHAVRQGSYLWWSIFNGVRYGADAGDDGGERPMLVWAAAKGDLPLVRELLDWRASPNATWSRGRTALSEALRHGHLDIAMELVARGASANARVVDLSDIFEEDDPPGPDELEITPLILAIAGGFIPFAHDLIRRGADVNARASVRFEPALAKAVRRGNVDLARALIDTGANLEVTFEHESPEWMDEPVDFTILRLACRLGRADIVRLLVAAGAVEELEVPNDDSILGDAYAMAGEGAAGTRAAVLAALQGR